MRGDVVVVTANYRPARWIPRPAPPASTCRVAADNAGMLDQVAALRWVRDNVGLRGDPEGHDLRRVGGRDVGDDRCSRCPRRRASSAARSRESGAAQATSSLTDATQVTELLAELGITKATVAKLRDVPADDLVVAQTTVTMKLGREVFLPRGRRWSIRTCRSPSEAIASGVAKGRSALTGTTLDEWRLFTFMTRSTASSTRPPSSSASGAASRRSDTATRRR